MIKNLINQLNNSLSPFHVVKETEKRLIASGFTALNSCGKWNLVKGGKYFVKENETALVAFVLGENYKSSGFDIVATHTDSPCFKIKYNPELKGGEYVRLNTEVYGGTIYYTWFDRPLKIAGRVIVENNGKAESKLYQSENNFIVPSVAIHLNRDVNKSASFNSQTDLSPLFGGKDADFIKFLNFKERVLDYDLYICSATDAFVFGAKNEFLASPRIDNLTSAFGSIEALCNANEYQNISVAFMADNEEIGSRTRQGAGGTFFKNVLKKISETIGTESYLDRVEKSFLVSCDNAHASHPNKPELSDPTNKAYMGGGIVIKHHAGGNYTSDAMSSAKFRLQMEKAGVICQDSFGRSDLACGSTLGVISSSQISVISVDIGLAQLAMHSACECLSIKDYTDLVKGLTFFYNKGI